MSDPSIPMCMDCKFWKPFKNESGGMCIHYNVIRSDTTVRCMHFQTNGTYRSDRFRVVIEVKGGVADVTSCPPEVDVEIIDHDNEGG